MYQLFIFGFSLIHMLLVIWNEPALRGATSSDFLLSFFLLVCFFLSVSPVAEPKITEERRLTVITPSLPLESGTAGSLVPPFQEPPAHFFPSVIHEWRTHTFKLGFYLPVRLVISENYHQNGDGACAVKRYCGGNFESQVNWEASSNLIWLGWE